MEAPRQGGKSPQYPSETQIFTRKMYGKILLFVLEPLRPYSTINICLRPLVPGLRNDANQLFKLKLAVVSHPTHHATKLAVLKWFLYRPTPLTPFWSSGGNLNC